MLAPQKFLFLYSPPRFWGGGRGMFLAILNKGLMPGNAPGIKWLNIEPVLFDQVIHRRQQEIAEGPAGRDTLADVAGRDIQAGCLEGLHLGADAWQRAFELDCIEAGARAAHHT
jgi:hypothetical protein